MLSERLEVRLSPRQMALLRREARRRGLPVAHLIREAIDLLSRRTAALGFRQPRPSSRSARRLRTGRG